MAPRPPKQLRCAIYTRKSSEEGLEQSFNSLDAQREACEAFIRSQRHEGWIIADALYDDGGFSGGTMERPALQRLLTDIGSGRINVVVVYKVDRLTRSLTDFAKIVETFDRQGVSFVSVTQQFNTTSSMGRLTLNVLLSFAQFEREVTGERIRDKIAASRRKGMWMGGVVPLGYDVQDRKLVVNQAEADSVRQIFSKYVELGNVSRLRTWLDDAGLTSKVRPEATGKHRGGRPFSRGALYTLLRNRVYLGQAVHKGEVHAGEHQTIVDPDLWQAAQTLLDANRQARSDGDRALEPSLLVGLLHDNSGRRLTPSHAVKGSKRYRYYVSAGESKNKSIVRLPAHEIEYVVCQGIVNFLTSASNLSERLTLNANSVLAQHRLEKVACDLAARLSNASPGEQRILLRALLSDVMVTPDRVDIQISQERLLEQLGAKHEVVPIHADDHQFDLISISVPARLLRCVGENRMVLPDDAPATGSRKPNASLIKSLARAHDWKRRFLSGKHASLLALAEAEGFSQRYVSQMLRLAFLAPNIVEAILEGRQPVTLSVERVMQDVPPDWNQQSQIFGFN
ncbi:MAG TPA: recombinase family protein [Candidatus Cybelea sp.]|nr:recombinase family protein [Candidatus Cybelea sp.]